MHRTSPKARLTIPVGYCTGNWHAAAANPRHVDRGHLTRLQRSSVLSQWQPCAAALHDHPALAWTDAASAWAGCAQLWVDVPCCWGCCGFHCCGGRGWPDPGLQGMLQCRMRAWSFPLLGPYPEALRPGTLRVGAAAPGTRRPLQRRPKCGAHDTFSDGAIAGSKDRMQCGLLCRRPHHCRAVGLAGQRRHRAEGAGHRTNGVGDHCVPSAQDCSHQRCCLPHRGRVEEVHRGTPEAAMAHRETPRCEHLTPARGVLRGSTLRHQGQRQALRIGLRGPS
mmetsp:Transcript_90263/g.292103  ORF Transcript_90263/g.292103 Transcript_90263/m.292103 type:complete len:279 (-) Transcript_90263:1220-2056(-)